MSVRKAGKLDCWIVGKFGFSGFLNKQKISPISLTLSSEDLKIWILARYYIKI